MRFMVIVKATKDSEAGVMPSDEAAGRRWASSTRSWSRPASCSPAKGCSPSSKGARVRFSGEQAHGDRRSVRRDEGAHRRVLDVAGEVEGRGDRVGEALPQPDRRARARSRFARCSRPRISAKQFTPELREQEERLRAADRRTKQLATPACRERLDDGVIGSRDGYRDPSRHRRGLADGVGEAHRRARPHRARRRPGRGPRAGRAGRGARAVAGVGHPRQSRRLADGRRQAPRHRSASAGTSCSSASTRSSATSSRREQERPMPDLDAALDDDVGDDLLRLIFIACHPVLSTEARVALTLRLLGGLTTEEIARAFLVPEPTIAQRIVRAKRTLAEAQRAVRSAARRRARGAAVVGARGDLPDLQRGIFGDRRRRLDASGAVRGRVASRADPRRARAGRAGSARPRRADGDPGVARRGPRRSERRADPAARSESRAVGSAARSSAASRRSSAPSALGGARGPYVLQAAIAACHARARAAAETDWTAIVSLYGELARLMPSPVVELNRAVAVSMASGPATALALVDAMRVSAGAQELSLAAQRRAAICW